MVDGLLDQVGVLEHHLAAAMEATLQGPDGKWTGYQYATWDLEGTAHGLAS